MSSNVCRKKFKILFTNNVVFENSVPSLYVALDLSMFLLSNHLKEMITIITKKTTLEDKDHLRGITFPCKFSL